MKTLIKNSFFHKNQGKAPCFTAKRSSAADGQVCTERKQKWAISPSLYIFVSADKQYLRTQKQEDVKCEKFVIFA